MRLEEKLRLMAALRHGRAKTASRGPSMVVVVMELLCGDDACVCVCVRVSKMEMRKVS